MALKININQIIVIILVILIILAISQLINISGTEKLIQQINAVKALA